MQNIHVSALILKIGVSLDLEVLVSASFDITASLQGQDRIVRLALLHLLR